jgi:cytochrome c
MRRPALAKGLLLAGAAMALGAASPPGDPRRGEQLFAACAACHTLDATRNELGPHLKGVVGRPAAAVEDYTYSGPMRRSGITWTPEVLDQFLADPQVVAPGNKMPFAGMPDPKDRADIIAYLQESAAGP